VAKLVNALKTIMVYEVFRKEVNMSRFKNLIGEKFGKLTVVENLGLNNHNKTMWKCICECGNEKITISSSLNAGLCKSCGCLQQKHISVLSLKHSLSKSRQYKCWHDMKTRCNDLKCPQYKNYGMRGIVYDIKWETFEGFWKDMAEGYSDNLTLDRINVNKNYTKDNCRWTTQKRQGNNKRNNHYITYKNITHTLMEWSEILDMNYNTLKSKIRKGITLDEIFKSAHIDNF
jgi:hypothetical protein